MAGLSSIVVLISEDAYCGKSSKGGRVLVATFVILVLKGNFR
jgi:hypothetical protein